MRRIRMMGPELMIREWGASLLLWGDPTWPSHNSQSMMYSCAPRIIVVLRSHENNSKGSLPRRHGRRHYRHLAPVSVPRITGDGELRRRPVCQLRARDARGYAHHAAIARPAG